MDKETKVQQLGTDDLHAVIVTRLRILPQPRIALKPQDILGFLVSTAHDVLPAKITALKPQVIPDGFPTFSFFPRIFSQHKKEYEKYHLPQST